MNRRIRKLAPYLQSVSCLRKDAQKGKLGALVSIFTRTEREILNELLKAVLRFIRLMRTLSDEAHRS